MSGQCWKVVGGGNKGGIVAKVGIDATSDKLDKLLATNAIVQELELNGQKLRYKLISGVGPPTGWVSIKLQNKDLLIPDDTVVEPEQVEEIPETAPEFVYFDSEGLGELTRLVFKAGGVAFKDTRLPMDALASMNIVSMKETILRGESQLSAEDWPALEAYLKESPGDRVIRYIPCLFHGPLKLTQTVAITQYAADIGMYAERPRTADQRGLDWMILGLRADLLADMFPCDPNRGLPEKVRKAFHKQLFGKIEHQLSGLERAYSREPGVFLYTSEADGPSLADLAVFNLVTSPSPGLLALGIDMSMYPKVMACVDAVRKSEVYPGLKAYIEKKEF